MRFKNYRLGFYSLLLMLFSIGICKAQKIGCQSGKNMLLPPGLYNSPENLRSDTFDILKYTINLEIGNTITKLIKGNTVIRFAPKMNGRTFIRLDLLKLTIDSVKENTSQLVYSYNDTILKINFGSPKNMVDTSNITVYYKGQPQGDASGWGGFYFDNTGGSQYAYNLGVGFAAKPHNYGRVWFPCFDNFVERSKFEFNITSDSLRRAYCNGQLISDNISGTNRTRKWVLNEEIPTYLASVSVANYKQVNWLVNTLTGIKPIILAAAAADTTSLKNGFVNLKTCINGFENYYGPYKWNRFGYCLVPFNSGAMEHVTNISYPKAVAGNLGYEADLMAHELSHHWWGDNITCETQEDMWINEGMATYSQYMFTEWKYGKSPYLAAVKNTHESLLHFVHHKEGGFRAVSGIPHALTYGDHVYKKGADMAHTLRSYMGDTAFFNAVKYTMTQNQFKSINSIQFRNLLQTSSGQNLTDFFNNWILSGGWPHFAIDSVSYVTVGANSVNAIVSLKQKIYGAPALFSNVPLELTFFKNDWTKVIRKVVMSGAAATFTVNIPFNSVYCALNYDSKISDATSFQSIVFKTNTAVQSALAKAYIQVKNKGVDSSLIRIVHNYVRADPFKNNPQNHILSDQHFWTVEGILSPGFHATLRLIYNGNKGLTNANEYLDTLITRINGDSVRLFYRADSRDDWKLVKNYTKFISGQKVGYIDVDTMKLGQYTFGNSTDTVTVNLIKENNLNAGIKVYPNPVKNNFKIELPKNPSVPLALWLLDSQGRLLLEKTINEKINQIDVSGFLKGTYLIKITEGDKMFYSNKIIIIE